MKVVTIVREVSAVKEVTEVTVQYFCSNISVITTLVAGTKHVEQACFIEQEKLSCWKEPVLSGTEQLEKFSCLKNSVVKRTLMLKELDH